MVPRLVLRLIGVALIVALCLNSAAFAQGGDAQTQALVRRLQEGDRRDRLAAAEEIKGRGVAALTEALKDRDRFVRVSAAKALGNIGGEAGEAVAALVGLLKDEEPLARAAAATALSKLGGDARAALPALYELQNEQATVVRIAVVEAINKIASHRTRPQN